MFPRIPVTTEHIIIQTGLDLDLENSCQRQNHGHLQLLVYMCNICMVIHVIITYKHHLHIYPEVNLLS